MKNDEVIKNYINTDADSSIKGIVLQKLRVVERLLSALLEDKKCIFSTIEYVDDVIEIDMDNDKTDIKTEQNKNYATPFSINSKEVKNSLRIFLDNWRKVEDDENMTFLFYTNTSIAKEKSSGIIKDLEIELPDKPVIELLINKDYEKALPIVIPVLKEYYVAQHKKNLEKQKKSTLEAIHYYEDVIDKLKKEEWIKFLDLIEWSFNEDNEIKLRKKLIETVAKVCGKFNVDKKYSDKILSCIIDLIEKQSAEKSFLKKMVHVSQIELLFKDFVEEVKVEELLDPMYRKWDDIENNDIRDLKEKIINVCKDFDSDEIEEFQDDFVDGKYEQESHPNIREVKAYNYRVYKVCKKDIRRILKEKEKCEFSQQEVEEIFENLMKISENHIIDKAKTYKMPYMDRDMVRKTILILFQECFLALDKVGEKNG